MSLRYVGGLISPSVNPLAANVTTSPNVAQYNGSFTLQQQAQALTSGQWATDPYYKNTTLLLHADGKANGSQNNTFLDSSTNNFTITRNGNTTQGSFTPYGSTWSNYFVVGTGSIDFPTTSNLNLTGNFTIDFWFNLSSIPTTGYIFSGTASTIQLASGNLICYDGAQQPILTAPAANTWYYIALVRSGTTVTPYVNGVAGTPFTNSSTTVFTHSGGRLGAGIPSGASPINGYLSNYRVSNIARTISLPTTPPTQDANTLALVCASNRFNDLGINNLTLTVGSGVSVQRFSPFAPQYQYTPAVIGGSGYFDGSGDYLSIANNTALQIPTGDFTLECWFNCAGSTGFNQVLFSKWNGSGYLVFVGTDNKVNFQSTAGGLITASTAISYNSWNHVAAVRNGNVYTLYVNGISVATATSSSTNTDSGTSLDVGRNTDNGLNYFYGYVSNFRVVKGTAIYTAAFTPPTAPLTAVTNTQLLCNMTNAGIYDNAMMNNLETVGNAQVSTSVVKYGSGSLKFDGAGDALVGKNSPNYNLSSGDFTVEFWFNTNTLAPTSPSGGTAGYAFVLGQANWTGASGAGWAIYQYNQQIQFYAPSGTLANIATGNVITATGTWYHVAVVRSGSTTTIYINGVSSASGSLTISNSTYPLMVGGTSSAYGWDQEYITNGYIDDVRITKGVARYTANFQPPKVAMANQ